MNSRRNYYAFLWHAVFLSITVTFTEINTILPSLVLNIGGNEFHVGILTAIMVGVPLAAQLFFAGFLHTRRRKKPYLLTGIYLRILSLTLIALTVVNITQLSHTLAFTVIYLELFLFTVSGAFAGISYLDIMGKSFIGELRKKLFLRKQLISSIGVLTSAIIARSILSRFGYPDNYFILFVAAAAVLFLASGGFWIIREESSKVNASSVSFMKTVRAIPGMLSADHNLAHYIIVTNMLGYSVVLLPFYLTLARKQYEIPGSLVGNLLLLQILGMIISSSLVWPSMVKKRGFKGILFFWAYLSAVLPCIALLVSSFFPSWAYVPIFVFSGISVSAYKITSEAVLIEISTDDNRALYSGIIGTLSLSVALFPLISGALINVLGYFPVFVTGSLLALGSTVFIRRMRCPVDDRH